MELLQLKYFCDAAQTENFSKTAKKYDVPPSNISQSIKRLENELGVNLFNRKSNSLTLSEQGRTFYTKIKEALNLIEDARSEIADTEEKGTIKICIMAHRQTAMRVMEKFRQKYPQVVIMSTYSLPEEGEEFDLIIADDGFEAKGAEKEMIVCEEISLAVNTKNPISKKSKITASNIKKEAFVCMNKGSSMYTVTQKICKQLGFEPNIVMQSPDPAFIRKCVELDLGITFVPTISWHGLFSDHVAIKKLDGFYRTTYAYKNTDKFMKKSTKKFLEMFKSERAQ